jgi:hypothetical protein
MAAAILYETELAIKKSPLERTYNEHPGDSRRFSENQWTLAFFCFRKAYRQPFDDAGGHLYNRHAHPAK